jgi:hypothetical protein
LIATIHLRADSLKDLAQHGDHSGRKLFQTLIQLAPEKIFVKAAEPESGDRQCSLRRCRQFSGLIGSLLLGTNVRQKRGALNHKGTELLPSLTRFQGAGGVFTL